MNDFTIIIPARLASSRLPEKLLQNLDDKSVLEHTYRTAVKSQAKRVVIAADDARLVEAAAAFGAEVLLTDKDHQSGTDRLAEAVQQLRVADGDIIVNLQGDEPFMPVAIINSCAATLMHDNDAPVATVATPIHNSADIGNPNAVKVVVNKRGHALYFSRAAIPFNRDSVGLDLPKHYFHHLGIYAYRAGFLKHYKQLSESHLENIEKLEQLRILDHGDKIAVAIVDAKPPKGIDTEDDLRLARKHLAGLL